jgi:3-phosphoshikimate 1-carboxyvinyltransferase
VTVRNVGINPTRDGVVEILRRMGANVEELERRVETGEPVADLRIGAARLHGVSMGPEMAARTIDEYPILAVAAAVADGQTVISGVKELRYKESDRIAAMSAGLRALGVAVEEREDGMTINGIGQRLRGGCRVKSHGDHRIAMAFTIAGLASESGIEIDDADCVNISFPSFFDLVDKICLH